MACLDFTFVIVLIRFVMTRVFCTHWVQVFSNTHWGRVTHIRVSKLTVIGSDNGLSPGRRQAIIWTNAGILLIGPSGTYFEIHIFLFKKMRLKVSSAKWRPFFLGLNEFKCETCRRKFTHTQFYMIMHNNLICAIFYYDRTTVAFGADSPHPRVWVLYSYRFEAVRNQQANVFWVNSICTKM